MENRNLASHSGIRTCAVISLTLLCCGGVFALEPDEIMVIANKDIAESMSLAQYYCTQRGVPDKNIFALSLGASLKYTIIRNDYEKQLVGPIRTKFFNEQLIGQIKCLLTIYGVPVRVRGRGVLEGQEDKLKELNRLAEQEKEALEKFKQAGLKNTAKHKQADRRLAGLQDTINYINGKETDASVDSELSMALFDSYELYRWQPNMLNDNVKSQNSITLMVSRLDGPNYDITKGLVDKAIATEKIGLKGTAYIDSRDIKSRNLYGHFDQSLRNLAAYLRSETDIPTKEDRAAKVFTPGSCPETALYCGWYSAGKYVDAFDFVDGAVGYHIGSFEAVNLRDPNSSQWCPSMLMDGITVTLGPVKEPYLSAFPEPRAFFPKLYEGNCLVEAYYRTKPFNSWQMLLIGDPLYRPFKTFPQKKDQHSIVRESS
ncbi:MAG: TIGR03790 family protein [Sedimentisphaerales bacterium]|nr:TIGR03790 family protein [Sedimentisphaerales bacterium]